MTEMQVAHIIRADRFEIDSVPFTHDRVAVAFLLMGLSLGPIEYRVVRLMQTHTHGKTLLLFVPYWRFPRAQLKDFLPADLMY